MSPAVGDTVHVIVKPDVNGGSDTARADIVHVHGQAGPRWSVDYRITLADGRTTLATSAHLHDSEAAARKARNVDGLAAFPAEGG